jgi:hypothetical protein
LIADLTTTTRDTDLVRSARSTMYCSTAYSSGGRAETRWKAAKAHHASQSERYLEREDSARLESNQWSRREEEGGGAEDGLGGWSLPPTIEETILTAGRTAASLTTAEEEVAAIAASKTSAGRNPRNGLWSSGPDSWILDPADVDADADVDAELGEAEETNVLPFAAASM